MSYLGLTSPKADSSLFFARANNKLIDLCEKIQQKFEKMTMIQPVHIRRARCREKRRCTLCHRPGFLYEENRRTCQLELVLRLSLNAHETCPACKHMSRSSIWDLSRGISHWETICWKRAFTHSDIERRDMICTQHSHISYTPLGRMCDPKNCWLQWCIIANNFYLTSQLGCVILLTDSTKLQKVISQDKWKFRSYLRK